MDIKKQLSQDPALFKIALAKHFLSKIPTKIPQSTHDCLVLEANIDSFLFFAASVIDVIKREINEEFDIFDKENVFYIHGIRKHLGNSGKQKTVKKIIENYFTTPTKSKNRWNVKQSSLWKLQILRNKVTHGHVLKLIDKKTIKLTYMIKQYKQLGEPFEFDDLVQNPREYFARIFDDLEEFVAKTRKAIRKNPQ